jgi:hypothetical protein
MSFFNICWESRQLGGACFMHVPANFPYVFISEYPSPGLVVNCESVCAVFHKSPPLPSFWQNCYISVGLSTLHWLCITFPPKISRLSLHFTQHLHFLLVQRHRSMLSARIFWKRKLKPLMTMRYFPFSLRITAATFTGSIFIPAAWDTTGTQLLQLKTDCGTQLILWSSTAWYTTVIPLKWPQDATGTLTLSSPGYNWRTAVIWKVTEGRN